MVREMDPNKTSRAAAYRLWMDAPNPMVTFMKTLDVTNLVKLSRRRGLKFNMLLCWCIGKAAAGIEEFYTLPVADKWMQYDALAVCTIVGNRQGASAPATSALRRIRTLLRKRTCNTPPRRPRPVRIGTFPRIAWSSVPPPSWTWSWTGPWA